MRKAEVAKARANDILQDSEKRYRLLAENISDVVWINDFHRLLWVSPSIERVYGYGTEEYLADPWKGMAPADKEVAMASFGEHIRMHREGKNASPWQLEFAVTRKDGRVVWTESTYTFLLSDEGRPIGALGTSRDITERRRAEVTLQDSERRYRLLAENVTDGVWTINKQGLITYISPHLRKLIHYDETNLFDARPMMKMVDHAHREAANKVFREALACARRGSRKDLTRTWSVEWQMALNDRPPRWYEARIGILRDDANRADGLVCVVRDIDDRKRAEHLFRTLADSSPIAIYILENGKFRFANRQFELYAGYPEQELMGMPASRFILAKDREKVKRTAIAMLKGDRSDPYEYRYVNRDGTVRWVLERVTSIDFNGERATLGNFMDITERKRYEEALRDSEAHLRMLSKRIIEVQEQERARIARDLHDQLGQELVFLKIKAVALAEQLGGASVVHEPALELVNLIDQVKATSHRLATSIRPGMLDDLGLAKALQWYAGEFEKRTSIACFVDVPGNDIDVPGPIATAAYRIVQEAFTNVCRHAKATTINLRIKERANTMTLQIWDNGRGFEANALNGGEALGLIGMRERARLLGGKLTVSSRPGKGTRITASFPYTAPSLEGAVELD